MLGAPRRRHRGDRRRALRPRGPRDITVGLNAAGAEGFDPSSVRRLDERMVVQKTGSGVEVSVAGADAADLTVLSDPIVMEFEDDEPEEVELEQGHRIVSLLVGSTLRQVEYIGPIGDVDDVAIALAEAALAGL